MDRLTQSDVIKGLSKEDKMYLNEMCRYANKAFNTAIYLVRQHRLQEGKTLRQGDIYKLLKQAVGSKMLQDNTYNLIAKDVDLAYQSYFSLLNRAKKGEYDYRKIKEPGYRKDTDMYQIIIRRQDVKLDGGFIKVPMSREFRKKYPGVVIKIPCRLDRLEDKNIKIIRIIPINNGETYKINYIYESEDESRNLDKSNILAIDIGVNNLASCVTTLGDSFLIDGKRLKSINQGWNKQKSHLQSIANKQGLKTTKKIQRITQNRNNQVKDTMFKAARYIVDYSLKNNIGTIVLGYNTGIKSKGNMGRKNNQNFGYIPYTDLRNQLSCLCQRYGMEYIEHNESYTSRASFLDDDPIPEFDKEHRGTHTFSGKRKERGLYQSADGTLINADINGAANILRKAVSNYDHEGLRRGVLKSPERIRLN